jgi:pimeloyl-ACP methyl ester carboxylesterase
VSDKPLLVLLPGMDGTGELFAPFLAALNDQVETLVVDYPRNEPLGYDSLEVFVRERLPAKRRFVLLGESFSGPVAISIAAKPPQNLAGLVLCCTFASNPVGVLSPLRVIARFMPVERAPKFAMSHALMGRDATPELRVALDTAMSSVSARAIRARAAAVLSLENNGKVALIDKPLLYLRALRDRVVPRKSGDEILRTCKHALLVEIDAPHFLLQTRAVEAVREILQFINLSHVI